MNGSTNVFVENFVSDIQDKYNDIRKLEEVRLICPNLILKVLECEQSLPIIYRYGIFDSPTRRNAR